MVALLLVDKNGILVAKQLASENVWYVVFKGNIGKVQDGTMRYELSPSEYGDCRNEETAQGIAICEKMQVSACDPE